MHCLECWSQIQFFTVWSKINRKPFLSPQRRENFECWTLLSCYFILLCKLYISCHERVQTKENGWQWLVILIHLLSVFVWNLQTWCFCRHQQPGSLHQIPESVIVHIWVSIGIGFVLQWTCKAWFDWAIFLWPMQTDVFQLEVFGFVVTNVSRIGTCKKCSKSFSVGNRDISTLHVCCCGCMKVLYLWRGSDTFQVVFVI